MNWKNAILALALILALGLLIWLLVEKSRSSDLARDMERLRYSSNQANDQLGETQRQREQLNRQITDKDREISQLRAESERNAAAANTAKRTADSLKWDVDSLRSAESNAKAEIDKHRLAAEAAATELAAAQSRLEGLADSPSDAEYQALLGSQAEAQVQIAALTANLDQARAENEKLRQEAQAAAQELAAARKELEKRLKELETAARPDAEFQALLGSQAEAQGKLESLTVNLDQTKAENEKLRQEGEAAAQGLTAARTQAQELEKRLKELETATRPVSEFQALVSSEAEARAQVQALDKDKAENLLRITDLTGRLDQTRSEMEALKKELAERPEPCPPAEPAENKAGDEAGARSELEGLRMELETSQTARSKMEGELKAARVEAAEALEKSKAEAARLNDELSRKTQAELKAQASLTEYEKVSAGHQARTGALEAEAARLKDELSRKAQSELQARASLTECEKASAGHQARTGALEAETSRLKMEQNVLRDSMATVFVDQLLFNSGSVTLNGAGMEVLEAAARVVNQSPDRAVLVVGHSDDQAPNRQLGRYYPSNWELSAARAAAVVRHLTEKGGVDPVRLSLVGRSHFQPAVLNETDEGRQKNRRVEIIISNHLRSATEAP